MPVFTLDEILNDADYMRLAEPLRALGQNNEETARLEEAFLDVLGFFEEKDRLPNEHNIGDFEEQSLAVKFQAILSDPKAITDLKYLDIFGLLPVVVDEPKITIDDILGDEMFADSSDIFSLKHVRSSDDIDKADFVATKKPCRNFKDYEPLFDAVAADLESGLRKTKRFKNEQEIEVGHFFIQKGTVIYVAEKGEVEIKNGKKNCRLRLIYGNGSEGNHLLRSLSREMYKDKTGRRVTEPKTGPLFEDAETENQTGTIYVLKSLSTDPNFTQYDGFFHKIGVTSGDVQRRISGAKDDPTFLLAPVEVVASYKLIGINRNKLEQLLHKFFEAARANVEIPDRFSKIVRPQEWFFVASPTIHRAVQLIQSADLHNWTYDVTDAQIIKKK